MVAVGDFGCGEREKMVRVAIWHGWVSQAEQLARYAGIDDPVVVIAAVDALKVLPFRFNRQPRSRAFEQLQRRAGCRRFIIGVSSYAVLVKANAAEGWQADMEEMRRKGGTSVVCVNRTGQFLVAVHPKQPRNG